MAQNLYPLLLERPLPELMAMARRREAAWVKAAGAMVDAWRPRVVVPYSMTLAYFEPDQLHLNGYGRLVPEEFCAQLRAGRPALRTLVLRPGDRIDGATCAFTHGVDGPPWGDTLADYLALVGAHAAAHAAGRPRFAAGDQSAAAARVMHHLARRLADHPIDAPLAGRLCVVRLVGERGPPVTLVVDPDARRLAVGAPPERRPRIEITLPASLAELLVGGACDPFTLIHSHRIKFRSFGWQLPDPSLEVDLYGLVFGALFDPVALADYSPPPGPASHE
jgi:hypothetical protein